MKNIDIKNKLASAKVMQSPLLKLKIKLSKRPLQKDIKKIFLPDVKITKDSFDTYLNKKQYIQSSDAKGALSNFVKWYYERCSEDKDTDAFRKGRQLHSYLLDDKLKKKFKTLKYANNTKEGLIQNIYTITGKLYSESMKMAELRDIFSSINNDFIITESEMATFQFLAMRMKKYAGGFITNLLKNAQVERSIYHSLGDFNVKIRPDAFVLKEHFGHDVIISLKTTSASNINDFKIQANRLHYDVSEAFYQDVLYKATGRHFKTVFIVAQTVEPFGVFVLECSDSFIAEGRDKYKQGMKIISDNIHVMRMRNPLLINYDNVKPYEQQIFTI